MPGKAGQGAVLGRNALEKPGDCDQTRQQKLMRMTTKVKRRTGVRRRAWPIRRGMSGRKPSCTAQRTLTQLSTEKRNFVLAITFHGNPLRSYKLDCAHHAPRRASKYADAVTEKPPPAGAGTAVVAQAQSQDEGHARQRNQHRSTRSLPDLRRSYEAFRDADVRVQTLRSRAYGRAGVRRFAKRREITRSKKPQSRMTSRVRRPASP